MPREHRSIAKKRYASWKQARKGMVDALENIHDDLKLKAQIEDIFDQFDVDGSQGVDVQELRAGMESIGVSLSLNQAAQLVNEADADGDGFVQYEEVGSDFLPCFACLYQNPTQLSIKLFSPAFTFTLSSVFNVFAVQNQGCCWLLNTKCCNFFFYHCSLNLFS